MPRYRAKSMLFVDGARIKPGQEFTSDSPPTDQWELIEGKAAAKTAPKGSGAPQKLEEMTDDQLRDFIQTRSRSNKRPDEKVERDKLLEIATRLNKPDVE